MRVELQHKIDRAIKLSRWMNNRFVFFKVGRYEDYKKQQ